jgi:hypothetical protein
MTPTEARLVLRSPSRGWGPQDHPQGSGPQDHPRTTEDHRTTRADLRKHQDHPRTITCRNVVLGVVLGSMALRTTLAGEIRTRIEPNGPTS